MNHRLKFLFLIEGPVFSGLQISVQLSIGWSVRLLSEF